MAPTSPFWLKHYQLESLCDGRRGFALSFRRSSQLRIVQLQDGPTLDERAAQYRCGKLTQHVNVVWTYKA